MWLIKSPGCVEGEHVQVMTKLGEKQQEPCCTCKACCFVSAKENENKSFHEAAIVSLTAPKPRLQGSEVYDAETVVHQFAQLCPKQSKNVPDGD